MRCAPRAHPTSSFLWERRVPLSAARSCVPTWRKSYVMPWRCPLLAISGARRAEAFTAAWSQHGVALVQVIKSLNNLVKSSSGSESAKEVANLMYDTALLTSGFDVDSPKAYAAKVYGMMGMALTSGASKAAEPPAAAQEKKADAGPIDADQIVEEK